MEVGAVARLRVHEALQSERIIHERVVELDAGGFKEEWLLVVTEGKSQPYGYTKSGRILIELPSERGKIASDPLAGLVWSEEHGKKYVHQIWVDPEFQKRGVGRVLIAEYKKRVSKSVVISGPFSSEGRAFARAVKARIVNE